MSYCHNCGRRLPDGANFCTECGTAVPGASASAARLNGQDVPAHEAKGGGFAKGLVIGLAVAVLYLFVTLLIFGMNINKTDLVRESPEPAVEITDDLTALQNAYAAQIDSVLAATTDDFARSHSRGAIKDYDGDGYAELVLLYSTDGDALTALISRRDGDDGGAVSMECELWTHLAGGASGAVYSGTLDTGDAVLFAEASNWQADTHVATCYVYSLMNSAIELIYKLEYHKDADGNLLDCWVMNADGEMLSHSNVEQFLNIYNAQETTEAAYPNENHGTPLDELFG